MTAYTATALLEVTAEASVHSLTVPLRYLGSDPVPTTKNIATKQYADTYFQQSALVTKSWVDSQADSVRANLILSSALNSTLFAVDGDGNHVYPTVSELNTIMSGYADSSRLGAAGTISDNVLTQGVAKANSSGALSTADNPNFIPNIIPSDNVAKFYNCITDAQSVVWLTSSQTITQSTIPTAYTAASFTIPDPGFSYYPMNFVYIKGKSGGTASLRTENSSPLNIGRILVAPSSASQTSLPTNWFALGYCTSSPYQNWYTALPYVNAWTNNSLPVRPFVGTTALRGDLTLNLYLSNAAGSGYTFYASGLTWFVMVVPTGAMTLVSS